MHVQWAQCKEIKKLGLLNNYQLIRWDDSHLRSAGWATSANAFSTRTVDTFATCYFSFRMWKYAQCGPRLIVSMAYYVIVRISLEIETCFGTLSH